MRLIGTLIAFVSALLLVSLSLTAATNAPAPRQTDTRPDPDACTLLSSMDLEPLLLSGAGGEIDGRNYYPAPGMVTCIWTAQPRNHAADAIPRSFSLAFYHMADAHRAQAQLDRQPRGDARASMAITEGDDAVVRPSPTIVVARHGADVAVVHASATDLADPEQLEARYLLDALALKAAGATVKPPPWVSPDHVAKMVPLAPTGSIAGWTPPPQQVPAGAALIQPVVHGLKQLVDWRFALLTVLAPITVGLLVMRHRRSWLTILAGTALTVAIVTMLVGSSAATWLIDRYGATGAATVTGSFATSTQYNHHDVVGYRVLIGTVDHRTMPGEFRTDDFNVLGLGDPGIYPDVGDVFTVRYLPGHPQDFVIRNDDQSPWARKLACARLGAWRGEAERKARAAPGNAGFRAELARASEVERDAACQM